jgi:hypothetical protein
MSAHIEQSETFFDSIVKFPFRVLDRMYQWLAQGTRNLFREVLK